MRLRLALLCALATGCMTPTAERRLAALERQLAELRAPPEDAYTGLPRGPMIASIGRFLPINPIPKTLLGSFAAAPFSSSAPAAAGVSLSVANTWTAAQLFSADIELAQGQKLSFDGATEAKYFSSDGTTLTLTGLGISVGALTSSGIAQFTGSITSGPASGVVIGLIPSTTRGAVCTNTTAPDSATCVGMYNSSGALVMSSQTGVTLDISGVAKVGVDGVGKVYTNSVFYHVAQTLTVADNGGGTNAASTLNPSASSVEIVCNDAQGCDITMGETAATDGSIVYIVNTTSAVCNFADTSGVSELAGAFAMGQWDHLELRYVTDRWVEVARSNN